MILRSFNNNLRTAALSLAAVVTLAAASAHSAHAQALNNLFGGTTSNAAANVASLVNINGGQTNTNTLGSGYTGTVTLPAGVIASLNETLNGTGATGTAPNALVLTATGISAGATFLATKNFGDATAFGLLPNTQYQFAVSRGNGSTAGLLGNVNFTLSLDGTAFVNSSTGTGVLGGLAVNVGNLLTNNGSANFVFTTPAVIPAGSQFSFATSGNIGVSVGVTGSSAYILSGAAVTQVPEPGTVAAVVVGMVALAAWRTRHGSVRVV